MGEKGSVGDAVAFGAETTGFRYEMRTSADHDRMQAKFEENCLIISIPSDEARSWIGSEQIGIETMQPIGDDKFLRILVEKDLACLTERVGEDDSDAYPNPFVHGNY